MSRNPLRLPRAVGLKRRGTVRQVVPTSKLQPPGSGVKTTTISMREALERAFEKVGGEDYLVLLARKDPKTFAAMLAKLLPSKIEADEKLTAALVQVLTGIARNPGDDAGPPIIDQDPQPAKEKMH